MASSILRSTAQAARSAVRSTAMRQTRQHRTSSNNQRELINRIKELEARVAEQPRHVAEEGMSVSDAVITAGTLMVFSPILVPAAALGAMTVGIVVTSAGMFVHEKATEAKQWVQREVTDLRNADDGFPGKFFYK